MSPRLLIGAVSCACAVTGISLFAPPLTAADNWVSFQNGGQLMRAASVVPPTADQRVWSTPIAGYGQSSPVIRDGRGWVTSVEGPNKEILRVTAFRMSDGEILWVHESENASPVENTNYVSRAAPTPAADEHGVICLFEGGNLIALTHDGRVRWERNLVADYGPIAARHGLGSSIEQDRDSVFVWIERSEDPYLLSVDKSSGAVNWRSDGLGATSWSTPRLVPVDDGHHLVISGSGRLCGFDPRTGRRLWTFDAISGNTTPTPIPVANRRFLIGATVGRGDSGNGPAARSNGLVRISGSGPDTWAAEFVWQSDRATSSFGSPVVHQQTAFFVNKSGVLYGLDLETGHERLAQRISGSIWATPLAFENSVFFMNRDGGLSVATARGDEYQLSSVDLLGDGGGTDSESAGSVVYAVAHAGDLLLVRQGSRLSAFRLQPAGATTP